MAKMKAASGTQFTAAEPEPFSADVPVGGRPSFDIDVIEILPPAAAEKLRAMRLRSVEAHALVPPFSEAARFEFRADTWPSNG